jgi:hypothetical protein
MNRNLDFYSLRQQYKGKLYKDPDFVPSERILKHKQVQWCRPGELFSSPKFVVDGFSRFDVRQGGLGDCWFLAALATLTQHPKLFEKVVPSDNSFDENYAGIFHFR